MAPMRTSQYARRASLVNTKRCDEVLDHHLSTTFKLRAGVVKGEARSVERSESLDDVEHSSTLIM
jgi:hypothetical protein